MKFRLIERKRDNGEIYYVIQRRLLWKWRNFRIDEIHSLGGVGASIHSFYVSFKNTEQAKATLERIQRKYNYKEIAIYPTIDENIFYTLYRAKRHDRCDWYDTLIYGSYESCCKQIDELLSAKKNRKYKKIINI